MINDILAAVLAHPIVLTTVDAKTCGLGCNGSLGFLASGLLHKADATCHLLGVALLKTYDHLVAMELFTSILINTGHLFHLFVKLFVLFLDRDGVLSKAHNVLADAHLCDLAVILQLNLLKVNLAIDRIDRGCDGGFTIL